MKPNSRFECPSLPLDLRAMLQRSARGLWIALVIAMGLHLVFSEIPDFREEERIVKPLTTKFIKREPRLAKPLELRKRPRPKPRPMRRKVIKVSARISRRDMSYTSSPPLKILDTLAKPKLSASRTVNLSATGLEQYVGSSLISSDRSPEEKIDMDLEMLDIDALDTGRYHAMVIQDPRDKKKIRGFLHMATVYVPRIHNKSFEHTGGRGQQWFAHYVVGAVRHLVDTMNKYTDIKTDFVGRLELTDEELFKVPWVFFFAFKIAYELTESELEALGRYLVEGGFVFADSHPLYSWSTGANCHEKAILGALETQGIKSEFEIIPADHPIYHCFFDFDGPPSAADGALAVSLEGGSTVVTDRSQFKWKDHLKGVIANGRLVAVLSEKGYYSPWADWGLGMAYDKLDPTRQLQFGINTIVFALIQEGSITQQTMSHLE